MSNFGRAGRQTPNAYGTSIAGAIGVETTPSFLFGGVPGALSGLLYDGTLNPVVLAMAGAVLLANMIAATIPEPRGFVS